MFEIHTHTSAATRRELQELHRCTLPADSVPTFRGLSAALWRDNGEAVAYVTWKVGARYATLDRIGVLPAYRGLGLAGWLLDNALLAVGRREWRTYIAAYNIASMRLFISRGFVPYAHFENSGNGFLRFKKGATK